MHIFAEHLSKVCKYIAGHQMLMCSISDLKQKKKPEAEAREIGHSHLSWVLVLEDVPQAHELQY